MATLVKQDIRSLFARRAEEKRQHELMRVTHQGMVDNIRKQMEMLEHDIEELKKREEQGDLSPEDLESSRKVRQAMQEMVDLHAKTYRRVQKRHKKLF